MGNNLSQQHAEAISTGLISLSHLSSSNSLPAGVSAEQLQSNLAGLLKGGASSQAAAAAGGFAAPAASSRQSAERAGKKLQCRFCLDTFDRKFNKDRHEARKHAAELALQAAAAASADSMLTKADASSELTGQAQSDRLDQAQLADDLAVQSIKVSGRKRSSEEVALSDHELSMPVASADAAAAASSEGMDGAEGMDQDDATLSYSQSSEGQPAAVQVKRARVVQSSSATESTTLESRAVEQLDSELRLPDEERSTTMQLEAELDEVQDALDKGMLFPDGLRQELEATDAQVATCCTPFLSWLCLPAVTDSERVVKARRLDPKQLAPVKKNLAFLIKAMLGLKMLEPRQLQLSVFTQEKVCQQLLSFLEERQVGASRIYALFLLIKKVLVFLASSESARKREYIAPNTWNSWTCIDSICSDSNARRKQISQNRKLLGSEQSKQLAREQAPTRVLPTADDLRMPALFGSKEKVKKQPAAASSTSATAAASAPSAAAGYVQSVTQSTHRTDANELTPEELANIKNGCLDYLRSHLQNLGGAHSRFVAYLVTATLCLAAAPRQQVLRQWQLSSSFVKKADGRYWCLMLANMNKNGKATTFAISEELTAAYDHYLAVVRPKLLGTKAHSFVFCKQTGDFVGETFDFSDWTRSVCKELIGRPVNCHAFRAALVTSFYTSGATQSQMNALASVMAHDPATARNYYFKVDAQKQALEVEGLMRQAYLKLDHAATAAAAAGATAEPDVQNPTTPPLNFTEPSSIAISAQKVGESLHTDTAAATQSAPEPAIKMHDVTVEPLSAHRQSFEKDPQHAR